MRNSSNFQSPTSNIQPPTSERLPRTVVHIIDNLGTGGAQRQLVELVTRLPCDRWRPIVIALSTEHVQAVDELRAAGVEVHLLHQHGKLDLPCLASLTRLIRQLRPSIVHTWLFTADCYGRLAAYANRVPVTVCGIRNTVDDMPRHHRLANRWLTRWTSCVTINTEAIRPGLVREGGVPERKIHTIYNGIAVDDSTAVQRNGFDRSAWQLPTDALVVAMVARLSPQKDHRTFLAAAAHVAKEVPNAHFLVIGDGPLRSDLERWIAEHDLTERVRLLGERHDVRQLWHAIDLAVLATHYEGCSNVILEAMAEGVPVVATDVGGNRELILEGQTGLLVPPRSPQALAEAMRVLLQDAERRRGMGQRGRARIARNFSIETTVQRTAALYQQLMNNAGRG